MIFIFIIIGLIVIYVIAFNNRDKSQDYKLNPVYNGLIGEDKLRLDIAKGLSNIVNECEKVSNNILMDDTQKRLFITNAIENYQQNSLNNVFIIASTFKISVNKTDEIIREMCRGAYATYVLKL